MKAGQSLGWKSFTIGITVLFIEIAFSPALQPTIEAFETTEYADVTAEPCGIEGFGPTAVHLSAQEYQDLERYLDEFNARLNKTTSETEVSSLFKEAVAELHKFHLLPNGMSVTQAQTLVSAPFQTRKVLQKSSSEYGATSSDNLTNVLCLVAGSSNRTSIVGPLFWLWYNCTEGRLKYYIDILPWGLYMLAQFILFWSFWGIFLFDVFAPVILLGTVMVQRGHGSLFTLGLNGKTQHEGYLDGTINGFTGIKLLLNWKRGNEYFYLGSALTVNMSYS